MVKPIAELRQEVEALEDLVTALVERGPDPRVVDLLRRRAVALRRLGDPQELRRLRILARERRDP